MFFRFNTNIRKKYAFELYVKNKWTWNELDKKEESE